MMLAPLLDELSRLGIALTLDGSQLRVRGARGLLSLELIARIREAKPSLLETLRSFEVKVVAPPQAPQSPCGPLPHSRESLRQWAAAREWSEFRPLGGLRVGPGRDEWEKWLSRWTPAQVRYIVPEVRRQAADGSSPQGREFGAIPPVPMETEDHAGGDVRD